MDNLEKYKQLLELLMQAELAARNHEWLTCGIYARQAMELAYYNNPSLTAGNPKNASIKLSD